MKKKVNPGPIALSVFEAFLSEKMYRMGRGTKTTFTELSGIKAVLFMRNPAVHVPVFQAHDIR